MKKNSHTHPHPHFLDCADVYRHICDNLDSNLESPECKKIKEHIAGCPNCTAYLDSLKKTVYLYQHYPSPDISAKTSAKLFAVINLERTTRKPAGSRKK